MLTYGLHVGMPHVLQVEVTPVVQVGLSHALPYRLAYGL